MPMFTNAGGQWKNLVPYANIGGTWKVLHCFANVAGTWKQLNGSRVIIAGGFRWVPVEVPIPGSEHTCENPPGFFYVCYYYTTEITMEGSNVIRYCDILTNSTFASFGNLPASTATTTNAFSNYTYALFFNTSYISSVNFDILANSTNYGTLPNTTTYFPWGSAANAATGVIYGGTNAYNGTSFYSNFWYMNIASTGTVSTQSGFVGIQGNAMCSSPTYFFVYGGYSSTSSYPTYGSVAKYLFSTRAVESGFSQTGFSQEYTWSGMVSTGTYGFIFGGRRVSAVATNAIYKYSLTTSSSVSSYGTLTYATYVGFAATDTISALVVGGLNGAYTAPPSVGGTDPEIQTVSKVNLMTQSATTQFCNLGDTPGYAGAGACSNGHGGL